MENETSVTYIALIAFVANDFEIFLKTCQSMKTRIHIVYPEMNKVLTSLMSKFLPKLLRDYSNNAKSVTQLPILNAKDAKNCTPLKLIDIGTKSKSSFRESLDITSKEKKFRHNCLVAYQAFVSHLKLKLSWESTMLRNVIFLEPANKEVKGPLNSVTSLNKETCKQLGGVLNKIFPMCSITDEVCDQVCNKWKMYQIHSLPQRSYKNEANATAQGRQQILFWENAFGLAGLPFNTVSKCKLDIDALIISLEKKIAGNVGSRNFPYIAFLSKIVSYFSHRSSAPKNGFSISKYMAQLYGTAFDSDEFEAMRLAKDTILSYGGFLNVSITKLLLQLAKLVYLQYNTNLQQNGDYWSKQTK